MIKNKMIKYNFYLAMICLSIVFSGIFTILKGSPNEISMLYGYINLAVCVFFALMFIIESSKENERINFFLKEGQRKACKELEKYLEDNPDLKEMWEKADVKHKTDEKS